MADEIRDPNEPEAYVLEVRDHPRDGSCLVVTGRVKKSGDWLDAAFTVYKGDINHLNRDQLFRYAQKRLPQFTEDIDWMAEMTA